MVSITYYWTWAALNPTVDTTHFFIESEWNRLYVDAGNGMKLAQRVLSQEIEMPRYIFITHCHTDHLLWLPHLIRATRNAKMTIIITHELAEKVRDIMYIVWKGKWYDNKIDNGNIDFIYIDESKSIELFWRQLTPINLYSKKAEQYWFELKVDGKHIVFFWDEAIDVLQRDDLEKYKNCDVLLCEAFCTDANKEKRDPHSKAHITSYEAWQIGTMLEAQKIVISHIAEDIDIPRKEQLDQIKQDTARSFAWEVIVPEDNFQFIV